MKKILSIDGGGIRGIIPALVLAEIEEKTGQSIAESFDLIAGTSTGGILAMGLAKGSPDGKPQYTAKDLVEIYRSRGKEIFPRSFWRGVSSVAGLVDPVYSSEGIEKVLHEYFEDERLDSALTNVLITAYDIVKRKPLFLKSWRDEYGSVKMRHAARATSAAPTYFKPANIPVGEELRGVVDGGVFINSPSVSAFAEAKRMFPDEDEFLLLSLGSGELTRSIPYGDALDWGKVEWLSPLLSCMFDGVADAANYQMNMFLGENYIRLQTDLTIASDDMDNASGGNIENLKAEAEKLIANQQGEIEKVCAWFGG